MAIRPHTPVLPFVMLVTSLASASFWPLVLGSYVAKAGTEHLLVDRMTRHAVLGPGQTSKASIEVLMYISKKRRT
jgi:hypothetical protein